MNKVMSCVPGMQFPAVPEPNGALMLALQYQFEQAEKLSAEEIRAKQLEQAASLIHIAKRSVPLYRDRLPDLKVPLTQEVWESIPVLTRAQLIEGKELLVNKKPLQGHDQLNKITSSGSTGMPVTAYGTPMTRLFWDAFTLRDHLWHKRDLSQKLVSIRPENGEPGKPMTAKSWGSGTAMAFKTGPAAALNTRTDIREQLNWLQKQNPGYLLSLPSNLRELAKLSLELGVNLPGLKQIRSYGELLSDNVRDVCKEAWGVEIIDVYSAQEVGYIAMQCPEHGKHHIQSESLLVEILDENDRPCKQGEIGRVVVTTLLNFGAPLIRYAIGDYARFGKSCECGRGLPVLEEIKGRQRNMLKTPEGKVFWPSFPVKKWSHEKVKQFQFAQTSLEEIEIRLVVGSGLTPDEEASMSQRLNSLFGYPFRLNFIYMDSIPRSKSGKFEDFVSEIV
ncbi:phenylacetate--CoA ligase family protein [Neptuniibacter caesariensis]|uniref:AMP-dependent synthetase/ligase domain-containing protein n=1 Tax=Neptuniibacter caesariensis TaxID=207954 RepID=A0A7U8C4L6_NEPCE|nr:phenylacetate--CoA ligase family protein [Neptuniibacter caesariensis]EAR60249.1 hypothetical protein MED92_02249 [Oceanospirillum sp. MED92] [Neptuniibacter caesariensis]